MVTETSASTRCESGPVRATDFGAVGDGRTLNTVAIQTAIDAVARTGGGTVVVPAGTFLTGALTLRSHITLHLDAGATLLGAADRDAFPLSQSQWEGPGVAPVYASLIGGEDLDCIAVTGRGTIDGNGQFWWDWGRRQQGPQLDYLRPRLIRPINCRNVLIEGITLRNSPAWTVNPTACDNVHVRGVTVINPPDSPNTDGINPDSCANVRISDCCLDVGDDCVTIKSGKEDDGRARLKPCENITVTNCTMLHGHGGVVLGSEMSGGVRNVAISNCVFVGTDRGIRLKARRGRGGAIEDVRVSNIVMDGVGCPLVVNLFYGCGAWGDRKVEDRSPHPVDETTPAFRRLRFSNLTARNIRYAAGFLLGLPERWIEDIAFCDVSLYVDPHNTQTGRPALAPGVEGYCRAGFLVENVSDVTLHNVDIHDQLGPAIQVRSSRAVTITGLRARRDDGDVVELHDVTDATTP